MFWSIWSAMLWDRLDVRTTIYSTVIGVLLTNPTFVSELHCGPFFPKNESFVISLLRVIKKVASCISSKTSAILSSSTGINNLLRSLRRAVIVFADSELLTCSIVRWDGRAELRCFHFPRSNVCYKFVICFQWSCLSYQLEDLSNHIWLDWHHCVHSVRCQLDL